MNTLNVPVDSYPLERFFMDQQKQEHFVSTFHSELQELNQNRLSHLRVLWSTTLNVTIDNKIWERILLLPSRISICNRYREMQYNILHNVYISPYTYSKYTVGISPNCPKCKTTVGTRFHCLWECIQIQVFWKAVCREISTAIEQQLVSNPLVCLLGSIPDSLKVHKEVIQFLLMLARKAIMTKWVGEESPSIQLWKSLISDAATLEKLRYCIKEKVHLFSRIWEKPLNLLGITLNPI